MTTDAQLRLYRRGGHTSLRKHQEYNEALRRFEREHGVPPGGVTSVDPYENGLRAIWINIGRPNEGPEFEAMVVEQLNWMAFLGACDPDDADGYHRGGPLTAAEMEVLEAWSWEDDWRVFPKEDVDGAIEHLWSL